MQTATLADTINAQLAQQGFQVSLAGDRYRIERLIAERKAFLSTKKLTYEARWRIDEGARRVHFFEMLKESGMGLSTGGSVDAEMSPGFGFKKEVYTTGGGGRSGSIEEQSNLFGKKYSYTFDYAAVRRAVEAAAGQFGYGFEYHILPTGL